MNYQQTLEYLYAMLPMYQRIGQAAFKVDLTNTLRLCEALGNPQKNFPAVHIAGTNGKGSSSHAIASILQAAGYKTGLYTSPHLKEFTERIRINGQEISQEVITTWVAENKALIEDVKPSFFELTVALAFDFFSKEQVDIAVIEVGMGGRLDSTNVITPEVSLITNIGYDHMAVLGSTLPEIAGEKAGIIKKGIPVVVSERQAEIASVFEQKANLLEAPLIFASDLYAVAQQDDGSIQLNKNGKHWMGDIHPEIKAFYFLKNIPGIIAGIEVLSQRGFRKVTKESIREGLEKVVTSTGLKGRWQKLGENPAVICDVSHNPAGITELLIQLSKTKYQKLYILIGTVNDKDVNTVLSLLPKEAFYYFCEAKIPRALPASALEKLAGKHELKGVVVQDVNQALLEARNAAAPEDLILITGSTFVVAELNDL